MTPLDIDILLWCRTRCEPHPQRESMAGSATLRAFLDMGVIELDKELSKDADDSHRVYKTTSLGKAWVEALCNVPQPELCFIDRNGRLLETHP